ncbi:MAG: hypothetical protein ACYS7Y_34160 [Planctomycetota bacterium]|jgi:hypothetical protein
MPQFIGRGSTFIHRKFKVRVLNVTATGLRVSRVNRPGHVLEIPFSQLPKNLQ